jgi:hypothetical protein
VALQWAACVRSLRAFLKDTTINVRSQCLFRQGICPLRNVAFTLASTGLDHPSGPCVALQTWCRSQQRHRSTMAKRSGNRHGCARPTKARNIADDRQSGGKQDQVRLPAWIGVWDKGCRMEQPQPQRGAAFSWLFSRRSSRQLSVTLPERRYGLAAQLLASIINDATAALIPGRWTEVGVRHPTRHNTVPLRVRGGH